MTRLSEGSTTRSGCSCHEQAAGSSALPPAASSAVAGSLAAGSSSTIRYLSSETPVETYDKAARQGELAARRLLYMLEFSCGEQGDGTCGCTSFRPGKYATAVSLHNPTARAVRVRRLVIPTVLAGAPIGREPRVAEPRAKDELIVPPRSVTLVDCCRLIELLFGAPAGGTLSAGVVQLDSDGPIAVSVVRTAHGVGGGAPSIDVKLIAGQSI